MKFVQVRGPTVGFSSLFSLLLPVFKSSHSKFLQWVRAWLSSLGISLVGSCITAGHPAPAFVKIMTDQKRRFKKEAKKKKKRKPNQCHQLPSLLAMLLRKEGKMPHTYSLSQPKDIGDLKCSFYHCWGGGFGSK